MKGLVDTKGDRVSDYPGPLTAHQPDPERNFVFISQRSVNV